MGYQSSLRPVLDSGEQETAANFERVLNTEEAAALLQIHPKTLQKNGERGDSAGIPNRQSLAISRFGAGRVAAFWVSSNRHSCR